MKKLMAAIFNLVMGVSVCYANPVALPRRTSQEPARKTIEKTIEWYQKPYNIVFLSAITILLVVLIILIVKKAKKGK